MNYEKDIEIDASEIDVECLGQAKLMLQVTKLEAELSKQADEAKEKRDVVRAEVDKDIRANPEKFKVDKVTEAAIQSAISTDERYKKANQALIDAQFEANCAKGAVRAFDQRKSMLEVLSRLHGQEYFAGPSIPHDLSKLKEERAKQTEAGIGNKLTRTR